MAKKFKGNVLEFESRKWLITINNPNDNLREFLPFEPWTDDAEQDLTNWELWIEAQINPTYYAISFEYGLEENHTPHIHVYLGYAQNRRVVKGQTLSNKFGGKVHLDVRNQTHLANRNYVFKESLSEKNAEKIAERIEGRQAEGGTMPIEKYNVGGGGAKIRQCENPLAVAKKLIEEGKRPSEILDANPLFYRYKKEIREMFMDKRFKETDYFRQVDVFIHLGCSGSGKTYSLNAIDKEELFAACDYENGGIAMLDNYECQKVILMDEYRGNLTYSRLLKVVQGYLFPEHARYNNVYNCWQEVHITSILGPEKWYEKYWQENSADTYDQLRRRITKVIYHYMTYNGVLITDKTTFQEKYEDAKIEYHSYEIKGSHYHGYEELEKEALAAGGVIARYNDDLTISINLDLNRPEWLLKRDAERHAYWNKKKDIMNNDPFYLRVDEYKELLTTYEYLSMKKENMDADAFNLLLDEYEEELDTNDYMKLKLGLKPFRVTPENDIFHMGA